MKKVLVLLGVLLGLAIVAVVVIAFSLGSIVQRGVNEIGPRLTKTPVSLEAAELSPFSGSGTLTNLQVGNPEGWSEGNAFSLGRIHLKLQPSSLLGSGPIMIDELVIDSPTFTYEQRLRGGSNIKDLLDNIQASVGGSAEAPAGEEEQPPQKFIIRKLRLSGGTVNVGVQIANATVPLPELSYDDLGVQEGGITGGEIANRVLRDVLGRVVSVATTEGLKALPENAGGTLQSVTKGLQNLLGPRPQEKDTKETEK